MILFFISLSWLIFVLYFLSLISKPFFRRENLRIDSNLSLIEVPTLAVIIPARNEEANIERCVMALLNQRYPEHKYSVIVVDDNSHDNTAAIVKRIKANYPNVRLIEKTELPQGWTGKNHACWIGAQAAKAEWYCFIDADTTASPELLKTAIAFSIAKQIDLLSIIPFQQIISFSERLFLPSIFFTISSSINFKGVNDPSSPVAIANGQFLLFRQSTYQAIKGHSSVKNKIMEDIALAKMAKEKRYRFYWIFGFDLVKTRMYKSLAQIWEGFSKNMADIMGNRNIIDLLFTMIRSLLLAWMPVILPLVTWYALTKERQNIFNYYSFCFSALAGGLLFIYLLMTIKTFKIPRWYSFSLPLGFTMHALLTVNSFWKRTRGIRKWKDRTYA